ncbi:KR domain-containing protein [Aspergillus falconensis]
MRRWSAYLDALAHKEPGMKILELDGDPGYIAEFIVANLKPGNSGKAEMPRFSRFDVAGTGHDLAALQQDLGEPGNRVALKEVDLLQESTTEEISGDYDLVVLLLSRRGVVDDEAATFLRDLAASQVTAIASPCDITYYPVLEAVLGAASHRFPRIKGCIEATIVLKDNIFETMDPCTVDRRNKSQIQGTWNLHRLLPSGLCFFIMMSSISSIIGNRGRANYAAANSFMDGLAHYRHAHSERAQ